VPVSRRHDAVVHPAELLAAAAGTSGAARVNEWLASHLAVLFGLIWTVWAFAIIPLVVLLLPAGIRSVVFYLASGWIQLWALPLFVYVGNKLQQSGDAQSDAQHQALTHIAGSADETLALAGRVYDLLAAGVDGGAAARAAFDWKTPRIVPPTTEPPVDPA
jgi:hypothetical protein